MLVAMSGKDIKTQGFVIRRVNYGEADRILSLITPMGRISAIAKGVRKEKSRLAGGIEVFTLSDYNLHRGKGDLAVVTGAKMVKHYSNIVKDYNKMEFAGNVLKEVERVAENVDNPEYYSIVKQALIGIDEGLELNLIRNWFRLNLMRSSGEEMNLYRDAVGDKLVEGSKYEWAIDERCFRMSDNGDYGTNEIKVLRLMSGTGLDVVSRIKGINEVNNRLDTLMRTI